MHCIVSPINSDAILLRATNKLLTESWELREIFTWGPNRTIKEIVCMYYCVSCQRSYSLFVEGSRSLRNSVTILYSSFELRLYRPTYENLIQKSYLHICTYVYILDVRSYLKIWATSDWIFLNYFQRCVLLILDGISNFINFELYIFSFE